MESDLAMIRGLQRESQTPRGALPAEERVARSLYHEGGAVLPLVLVTLILTAGVIRLLGVQIGSLLALERATPEAALVREAGLAAVAANPPPPSACSSYPLQTALFRTTWGACGADEQPFDVAPALGGALAVRPDYDAVLGNPRTCPGTRTLHPSALFDTPTAATTCRIVDRALRPLTVHDNIELAAVTTVAIEGTSSGAQIALATPGYLLSTAPLHLAGDTLIIAGGSIDIAHLTTTSERPVRVTVLSSLGAITIRGVSGPLSLVALGRARIQIPPTPHRPPVPLPPQRRPQVVGISTQDAPPPQT